MTPLLLGALAVLLAGPAPALLAALRRSRRTPRAAMVLWQGIALAALLSAVGAGLSLSTDRAWRREPDPAAYVVAGAALMLTGLVLARLLLSAHRTGRQLRLLRRRHRHQVDVVARRDVAVAGRVGRAGVLVLDHELPVAYCLPGMQGARVIVSAGALARLSPDEVDAVLAHERAHLRARHDLVLEAFAVVHRAFPRWVSSAAALGEVRLLVEVLADRSATRHGGRRALGRALVQMADSRTPGGGVALGAGGGGGSAVDLVTRVRLLADGRPHRVQATVLLTLATAVLALPTTFVVAPWLTGL